MVFPKAPVEGQLYRKYIYKNGTWQEYNEVVDIEPNYIVYSDGTLVQWGAFTLKPNLSLKNFEKCFIQFQKNFFDNEYYISFSGTGINSSINIYINEDSKFNSFAIASISEIGEVHFPTTVIYRAVGKWKCY